MDSFTSMPNAKTTKKVSEAWPTSGNSGHVEREGRLPKEELALLLHSLP